VRPRHEVWPWLVQMGAGSRAGWYSYDFLDNGRHPSATRIVPELQEVAMGALVPALPGATDGFTLLMVKPEQFLVLGWLGPLSIPLVTWAFVLQDAGADSTRLIARAGCACLRIPPGTLVAGTVAPPPDPFHDAA
jgi:hypothetical protein